MFINIMVCPRISVTNKADQIKQKGNLGTDRKKILKLDPKETVEGRD